MLSTRFFVFLCILKCIDFTSAVCKVSKYEEGVGNWVKCSNASLKDALQEGGPFVSAITILHSRVPSLEENSFNKYGKSLLQLNIQNSNIETIKRNAFSNLAYLKKLSLSHNKITELNSQIFLPLVSLEQLDLQFNSIKQIDNNLFTNLPQLKLLNLDDNQLKCIKAEEIQPLRNLAQIRILENPLSLVCRGELTLWLRDHGINYYIESQRKKENWLDNCLWLCAIEDSAAAKFDHEMKRCVLYKMVKQLQSAILSTSNYAVDDKVCNSQIDSYLKSIENTKNSGKSIKNGEAIEIMMSTL